MKRVKTSTIWFCFLAYAYLSLLGMSGLNLCFGDDGHVSIEIKQGPICCGSDVSLLASADLPVLPIPQDSGCGPCVDVQAMMDGLFLQEFKTLPKIPFLQFRIPSPALQTTFVLLPKEILQGKYPKVLSSAKAKSLHELTNTIVFLM